MTLRDLLLVTTVLQKYTIKDEQGGTLLEETSDMDQYVKHGGISNPLVELNYDAEIKQVRIRDNLLIIEVKTWSTK